MKKFSVWLSFFAALFISNSAFAAITAAEYIKATETTSFTMYVEAGEDAGPLREAIVGSLNIGGNLANTVLNAGTSLVILTGDHAMKTVGLIKSYGGNVHTFVSESGKLITIFVGSTANRMISGFKGAIGALASGDLCLFTGEVARLAYDVVTNVVHYVFSQAHLAAKFVVETIVVSVKYAVSILHATFKAAGTLIASTARATWAIVTYAAQTLGKILDKTVAGALKVAEAAIKGIASATVSILKATIEGGKAILNTAVVIVEGTVSFFSSAVASVLGIFGLQVGVAANPAQFGENTLMTSITGVGAVDPDNFG